MGCEHNEGRGVVTGLAHVGVIVRDIQASLKFYTELLDFKCFMTAEVPGKNGTAKLLFLRCGTCVIELIEPPQSEAKGGGAVDHIALEVSDVDAMVRRLSENGITFETEKPIEAPMLGKNGIKSIFLHGPDNERIELSQEL